MSRYMKCYYDLEEAQLYGNLVLQINIKVNFKTDIGRPFGQRRWILNYGSEFKIIQKLKKLNEINYENDYYIVVEL